MDFSLFYILYRPEDMTEARVHEDMIVESILADELGYSCVWYAEHHFSRVGMIPDPLLICAAVAQKTKKIHVGTAISIMSFHDPIRLAEQAAMVDLLSGGRLELGIGRGSQPKEFQGFGAKPSESRERLKEGLHILSRLLEGRKVTFEGRHHQCADVEIFPKPLQKPRPPIWLAGTSPETYTYAGENGFKVMASAGFTGPEVYKQKFGLYEDAIRKSGGDPAGIERPLVHHIHVCDAEDADECFNLTVEGEGEYLRYRAKMNEVEMPEEEAKHLKRNWSYELDVAEIVRGGGIIADPVAVAEDICRLRDEYGVNHVILAPWRGPDHASVMRSIESFANDVMPLVNATAPVGTGGSQT